jgi:hypothetical protein
MQLFRTFLCVRSKEGITCRLFVSDSFLTLVSLYEHREYAQYTVRQTIQMGWNRLILDTAITTVVLVSF